VLAYYRKTQEGNGDETPGKSQHGALRGRRHWKTKLDPWTIKTTRANERCAEAREVRANQGRQLRSRERSGRPDQNIKEKL